MKAIIVGAGEVGYHLADRLSKEGHKITLIERNPHREGHLKERINANVIQGSGASPEVLEQAGIQNAEIFIAVTEIDEVNIVACLLAKQYDVKHKIARVHGPEFTNSSAKLNAGTLGIELIINPHFVVADEICEMVEYTEAVEAAEFADGKVTFLGYRIKEGSPFAGKALKDLRLTQGETRLVVTSIERGDKTLVPKGKDVFEKGDICYFVCIKKDVPKIRELFGFQSKEAKNIFILGAGHIGFEVARRLSDGRHKIKVIDKNDQHCRNMAERLGDVLVLCTDHTDVDTLKEEGIADGDAFIALTDNDQSNILGSLLAKNHGVKRAITLVNQTELLKLAQNLGIDACVSPRLATASAILKRIRRGNVISLIEQNDAEVLEIHLQPTGQFLDVPIQDIEFPKGAIVGAIVRGEEVIIPSGQDVLKANDRVIVFTLLESVPKVEKFFS